jgi:hypothetical protein
VVTDLDNSNIELWVNIVVGSNPGPTLAVVSGLHGSEWLSTISNLELLQRVDTNNLSGTLLVVPVANPIAFASGTRNIRDESDSPDLNRSFGGQQAWLADQLATAIVDNVLKRADAIIDFHCGPWGAAMNGVASPNDYTDPDLNARSLSMAKAFHLPHVRLTPMATLFPGPRSMIGYAGESLGIPSIVASIGGAGFDQELERSWIETSISGVFGVMDHLGMTETDNDQDNDVVIVGNPHRVNPSVGGMIEPVFPPEGLMNTPVSEGDLLGRVWSPYTFEVVEELRAPVSGVVGMVSNAHPARPGDWAYLVFETEVR